MSKIITFLTKNVLEILAIIILGLFIFYIVNPMPDVPPSNYPDSFNSLPKINVKIAENVFETWVADSEESKGNGLSGTKRLEKNQAMLFVFEKPGVYGFWMKDMLIPIDIIWINDKKEIVFIKKNVSPDTYPSVFFSERPAKYVLEIKDGLSDALQIKVGSKVDINLEN